MVVGAVRILGRPVHGRNARVRPTLWIMRQALGSGQPVWVSDIPTITPLAASVTSIVLSPANLDRVHFQVTNDSTAVLYLAWGPTAATNAYTAKILAGGFYELPRGIVYAGVISGIWSAANGTGMVTVSS